WLWLSACFGLSFFFSSWRRWASTRCSPAASSALACSGMRSTSFGSAYLPSCTWELTYEYRNRSSRRGSGCQRAHARHPPELPDWVRLCGRFDTGLFLGFLDRFDLSAWRPNPVGGSGDCSDGDSLGVLFAHLECAGPNQQYSRARFWHFRCGSPGIRIDDHHGSFEP